MTAWSAKTYPSKGDDGVRFDMSNRPGDISRAAWAKRGRRMKVRGAIGQKRGDWQWLKAAFALCGWTPEGIMGHICHKCFANTSTLPFTDPSLAALWRNHILTHEVYIQHCYAQNHYVSPVFNIPGLRIEHFSVDLMHTETSAYYFIFSQMFFSKFSLPSAGCCPSQDQLSLIFG